MYKNQTKIGIYYAFAAYIAWGILPIYWKALQQVPAGQILAHRIVWSFLFVSILVIFSSKLSDWRAIVQNRFSTFMVLIGSLFISVNWFIYIWAVNNERVVEASLGYYINPLLSVFLGMIVLRERLNFWQLFSLFLAFCGVAVLAITYGQIPWLALSLAGTFAFYGLIKKVGNLDSILSLAWETIFVMPIALAYLVLQNKAGINYFSGNLTTSILLIFSGVITALPLLWFAQAAQRVPLATMGFIQYLSPTLSLFLGVFLFKEPFSKIQLVSFAFIWVALLLYSFSKSSLLFSLQPKYFKRSKFCK